MHGIVFTSLRHFVTARFGDDEAQAIWSGEEPYLITRAYPDDAFLRLFDKVVEHTGSDPEDLLRAFGAFAAERTFVLLYPSHFEQAGDARTFLLTVEERIHELVRATIPNARPPQLRIAPSGDDGVRIEYKSPRQLCILLTGLVEGTAAHYGEQARFEHPECMLRGDPACLFDFRFSRPARAA